MRTNAFGGVFFGMWFAQRALLTLACGPHSGPYLPASLLLPNHLMDSTKRIVIFDMDGTLTRPYLRFDEIRAEIGLGAGPLLEAVRELSAEDRARAEAILERHEAEAAEASELQDGAREVVAAIRGSGMPVVLMTRNSRRSVAVVLEQHGLDFDMVWTRDDGAMKPSPEPIYSICRSMGVLSKNAWSVGDYLYDIVCGRAAGATTVLLLDADRACPSWAGEADHVVDRLGGLLPLLGIDVAIQG